MPAAVPPVPALLAAPYRNLSDERGAEAGGHDSLLPRRTGGYLSASLPPALTSPQAGRRRVRRLIRSAEGEWSMFLTSSGTLSRLAAGAVPGSVEGCLDDLAGRDRGLESERSR